MTIFGADISDYQGEFDMARLKAEGFGFVIIKATEGSAWKSRYFASNLRKAQAAGLAVAAYHYQRSNASAQAQVDNIVSMVPTGVGIIPDVEANGGGVDLTRDIVERLGQRGYRVPLSYIPKWYWQQIGSPSLAGLGPLWQSHYPDNNGGFASAAYARAPASYWMGFGGQEIKVLQFSSTATIAGRKPIDADAFEGTGAQLVALFAGGVPAPAPVVPSPTPIPIPQGGAELMERIHVVPKDDGQNSVRVDLSGTQNAAVVVRPKIAGNGLSNPMWVGNILAWGSDKGGLPGTNPNLKPGYQSKLTSHRRYELPGALWADVEYSAHVTDEFDIDCY